MIRISTPPCVPSSYARITCPRLAGVRLLVAEDHPDHQRLFTMLLRNEGAEVEVVDNGRSAIERALEAQALLLPFDAVLMDQQMPTLDGQAATRVLRSQGYRRPIVALTAHAMTGEREKCLKCGCDDYVSKPIDRDELIGVVARLATQGHALRPTPERCAGAN